jgi:phytoene desaturase (3,4-didehydrolycopene-forming)
MLRPSFIRRVFTLHPFTSIYSRASHYFKTDRLRRVFTFASMYMGMSPFDAPGTYSLLQYTELAEGIWYPLGGFHTVIAALVKIAERNGATFKLSTPVSKVLVDPLDAKRAIGVKLETGEELKADIVVVNADLIWSMENLFEQTSYSKRLAKKPVSCSSISFYWSIDRSVVLLSSSRTVLIPSAAVSYPRLESTTSSSPTSTRSRLIPSSTSMRCPMSHRSTSTAPLASTLRTFQSPRALNHPLTSPYSAAPAGQDTIVVLVPVGHISSKLPSSSDWSTLVDQARQHVYKTLEIRLGLKDFPSWVKHEIVNDPISWEERFNLHRGSILGLSHSFL